MARFINLDESFGAYEFGDIVRMKRKEKGWSIHELARRTGISQSYINRIELKDQKNVSVPVLIEICRKLDIHIKDGLRAFGYGIEGEEEERENVLMLPLNDEIEGMKKDYLYNIIYAVTDTGKSDIEKMEICLNAIKRLSLS